MTSTHSAHAATPDHRAAWPPGALGRSSTPDGHAHLRHLATVFGTVRVTRCAWRASGARNLYPADADLNLPARRRAAPFDAAHAAITRGCGKAAGKWQVEQLTLAAASDIDAFYAACAPMPCTDDTSCA